MGFPRNIDGVSEEDLLRKAPIAFPNDGSKLINEEDSDASFAYYLYIDSMAKEVLRTLLK